MSVMFTERHEPGLTGLIRELFGRVGDLVKTQIELTKTEMKVEGRKLAMAGLFAMLSITVGSIFLLLLGLSVLLILSEYLDFVWAAVITTGFYLALTAIFGILALWEIKRNSAHIDV